MQKTRPRAVTLALTWIVPLPLLYHASDPIGSLGLLRINHFVRFRGRRTIAMYSMLLSLLCSTVPPTPD